MALQEEHEHELQFLVPREKLLCVKIILILASVDLKPFALGSNQNILYLVSLS